MTRPALASGPLAAMILLVAVAQLLFKQAGLYAGARTEWLGALALNPWLWAGLATSVLGMGCWLLALRHLALAAAYPWTAIIYVLTPVASMFLYDESLGLRYLSGMAMVVAGVALTAGAARSR